jgi:hypothetical protein
VAYESHYAIHGWENFDKHDWRPDLFILSPCYLYGRKAPRHTKNKEWIEKHVTCPLDYVQIDPDQIRLDALEWGVSTSELYSLRNLTPDVFRRASDSDWHVKYPVDFPNSRATEENCNYCLDVVINIIRKKEEYDQRSRSSASIPDWSLPNDKYIGDPIYSTACQDSEVVDHISSELKYKINSVISGFNSSEKYFYVSATDARVPFDPYAFWGLGRYIFGYLLVKD